MNMTTAAVPESGAVSLGGRMTVARLRAWVREAQPGARLTYARGPSCRLDCGSAVADEVARLGSGAVDENTGRKSQGLGLVSEHRTRIAGEGFYLIVRNPRPVRVGELP